MNVAELLATLAPDVTLSGAADLLGDPPRGAAGGPACEVARLDPDGSVPATDGAAPPYRLVWTRSTVVEVPLSRTAAALADQGYLVLGVAVEPGSEPVVAVLAMAFTPPAGSPDGLVRSANLGRVLPVEATAVTSQLTARLHGEIDDLAAEVAGMRTAAAEGARATEALEAYRASRGYRYAVYVSRRLRPFLKRLR